MGSTAPPRNIAIVHEIGMERKGSNDQALIVGHVPNAHVRGARKERARPSQEPCILVQMALQQFHRVPRRKPQGLALLKQAFPRELRNNRLLDDTWPEPN